MEQLMYVIIFIGFIYFVVKAIELFANNSVIDEVRKLPLEERKIALEKLIETNEEPNKGIFQMELHKVNQELESSMDDGTS